MEERMEIKKQHLQKELERISRMNDKLEADFNNQSIKENEPERINKNILTMCEIVKLL